MWWEYFSLKFCWVFHQSALELSYFDQNCAKTGHLLFKTFESLISMDSRIVHWEGRMKTGPKWPVNSSQDLLLQNFLYQHFFFKWPYLGNETRFFKRVSAKILVSSRAFIPSFMKVTSPNSFILFQPLSWKKALFRGVPGGPNWATPSQNMPLGPFSTMQKRNDSGKPNWSFPGMFCDLFHFRLFQPFSRLLK